MLTYLYKVIVKITGKIMWSALNSLKHNIERLIVYLTPYSFLPLREVVEVGGLQKLGDEVAFSKKELVQVDEDVAVKGCAWTRQAIWN